MKYNSTIEQVLQKLNIKERIALGEGGEGIVFALSKDKVVKIYKNVKSGYLQSTFNFQILIRQQLRVR